MKKIKLLGCLWILFASSVWAASYDPHVEWNTVTTEHFNIHYYKGEESIVEHLTPLVEDVYHELTQRWDCYPWGRTQIVLVDNYDQSNGLTQILPYNLIVLRAVPPTADSALADDDDWMRVLFTHEFTHVLHLTDVRYPARFAKFLFGNIISPNALTPGWVIEGLPTYFETKEGQGGRGHTSYTEMLLRTDILNHRFLKIDEMAGSQYDWPGWQAQYLYGVGFWNYLSEKYGENSVLNFNHKYGASLWFFSLNNKSKRSFKDAQGHGKSFYTLWKDWKGSLDEKYTTLQKNIEQEGLKEGESYLQPQKGESFTQPVFSPDGRQLIYIASSVHHFTELRLRDVESGIEKVLLTKKEIQQVSFSPDGKKIVYSAYGRFKRYYNVADLYEMDFESRKITRLTKGERARDPDISPDGKRIVAIIQKTGSVSLSVLDRENKKWTSLQTLEQAGFPRWINDQEIVFVSHQTIDEASSRKSWNLFLISVDTGALQPLTRHGIIQSRPVVSKDRKTIYFSSDHSEDADHASHEDHEEGIFNIYAYDLATHTQRKISNVTSGAFSPAISQDGKVVYQYYNGKGYELRALDGILKDGDEEDLSTDSSSTRVARVTPLARLDSPTGLMDLDRSAANSRLEESVDKSSSPQLKIKSHKYSPWKKLFVPRSIFPNFNIIDGAFFLSGTLINQDPLERHLWYADVNYRSDNKFLGYGVGYTYNRYVIPVSLIFQDYTVNYGNIYGAGFNYFEERRLGLVGISYPWKSHRFSLNYLFENRTTQSGLPVGASAPTLGRYAGFLAQYAYRKTSATWAAISDEKGSRLVANFEMTHHALGASRDLEQTVAWGDARTYLEMPYASHHVVALRAAGGAAFGDQLFQGNFGLGGSIGESLFTGTTTRLFTLRGLPFSTFSRDRVWVTSFEYRFPLVSIQRGLGTWPIAINQAHFALFADLGDAMRRSRTEFKPMLGVGGELRADFILSWHLPIMTRLGYGVIVTNRDRIAGVKDDLTGADARNGVVILELGTSF